VRLAFPGLAKKRLKRQSPPGDARTRRSGWLNSIKIREKMMKVIRASMLVLALSVYTYAGDIPNGIAGDIPNGVAGVADTANALTGVVVSLLQSVLSLF
jgi:hypothetical protein